MQWHVASRWVAHLWALASALLILAFIVGGRESMRPTAQEALGLLLFPGGILLGFGIAWWREGLGGLITVLSLALFYVWLISRDGQFPYGPWFVLFSFPGFIHAANALFLKYRKLDSPG